MAETIWRRSPLTVSVWTRLGDVHLDSLPLRDRPHLLDRFRHDEMHGHRLAEGRLLGFDAAELEQVVDHAPEPHRVALHPLREPSGDDRDRPRWPASPPARPSAPTGVFNS